MVWLFDQQNASEITKYGDPSAFCLEQFQPYQYTAFTLLNSFFLFFLPFLFCSFCLKKDRQYHNKKRDRKKKKKKIKAYVIKSLKSGLSSNVNELYHEKKF